MRFTGSNNESIMHTVFIIEYNLKGSYFNDHYFIFSKKFQIKRHKFRVLASNGLLLLMTDCILKKWKIFKRQKSQSPGYPLSFNISAGSLCLILFRNAVHDSVHGIWSLLRDYLSYSFSDISFQRKLHTVSLVLWLLIVMFPWNGIHFQLLS